MKKGELGLIIYAEENKMVGNQFYWGILTATFIVILISTYPIPSNPSDADIAVVAGFTGLGVLASVILCISLIRLKSARKKALDIAKDDENIGYLVKIIYDRPERRRHDKLPSVLWLMILWVIAMAIVIVVTALVKLKIITP